MRQKVFRRRGLRPQLGDLLIERLKLDAQLVRFCLTAPVVLETREPGELSQQCLVFSAGMLLEPALAHPANVTLLLRPVPRRIADRPGGSQHPGDNGVDLFAAFQQRSGDLALCYVDWGLPSAFVAHCGEPRIDVNSRLASVPGIGSKRLAGAIALLRTSRQ